VTFITIRKLSGNVKRAVTPSQPQAVDVVHETSLLVVVVVVVASSFAVLWSYQQKYCHEYIEYSTYPLMQDLI
jgi:hypothetical protein